jgi:hypothetical protein
MLRWLTMRSQHGCALVTEAPLVERERELEEFERLLASTRRDKGAAAIVEGPAGIGKKCLLAVAGASAAGLEVLHARASELERSSPSASYDSSWSGSAAAGRWSRCATEERNWP